MSPAEQSSSQAKADQAIETIYTTVETQHDRTDWLTVVSNLRQINRQLVEEIARLEQALASTKQTLHTHKEQNQSHEITILQQQDELRIAHDQVGALFQQLETSHQLGQRQQTQIETLSQQLEIVQTIIPQIEAEHEQLRQKYQHQSQKLTKTEQVAIELHRRLKLQITATSSGELTNALAPAIAETLPSTANAASILSPVAAIPKIDIDATMTPSPTDISLVETTSFDSNTFTTEIEPAPPQSQVDIPNWSPSTPPLAEKAILSLLKPSAPGGWPEAILQDRDATSDRYNITDDRCMAASSVTIDQESTPNEPSAKSAPNWPAPTLNLERPVAKTVKIDLPKFPKKPEN
jgi:hypothetical protein